jgi:hypothetical protein
MQEARFKAEASEMIIGDKSEIVGLDVKTERHKVGSSQFR